MGEKKEEDNDMRYFLVIQPQDIVKIDSECV